MAQALAGRAGVVFLGYYRVSLGAARSAGDARRARRSFGLRHARSRRGLRGVGPAGSGAVFLGASRSRTGPPWLAATQI